MFCRDDNVTTPHGRSGYIETPHPYAYMDRKVCNMNITLRSSEYLEVIPLAFHLRPGDFLLVYNRSARLAYRSMTIGRRYACMKIVVKE